MRHTPSVLSPSLSPLATARTQICAHSHPQFHTYRDAAAQAVLLLSAGVARVCRPLKLHIPIAVAFDCTPDHVMTSYNRGALMSAMYEGGRAGYQLERGALVGDLAFFLKHKNEK